MKKFIRGIFLFTVAVLFIAIIADIAISKGLRCTERGHFYTMNALMNQKMNADVIILGNSRAACSYHPSILDSILGINSRNLGVSGQPFGISYLRWQLYRRNNIPPILLIINMDYGELNMVTNGFEKQQYYPYISDTLVKPYLDLYGFTWMEKHIPMYRYRGDHKLISIGLMELLHIRHDTKGEYIKGYSNKDWLWDGEKLETVLQNGKVKDQCNLKVVALLDGLLAEADKVGTKVIFVYAPLINKLKENLDEQTSLDAYHNLADKYHVPILDFTQMWICSDTSYFHDANHVNAKGAEIFTKELAFSIDSLGIFQK